ncbi:MAG: hypothetical protein Q7K43_04680 [Candidatus Woesearchaeota archaeon]|nr:hypothetical protein [Candidatus Woesearchaeota archaeon]
MNTNIEKAVIECKNALRSASGVDISQSVNASVFDFKKLQQEAMRKRVVGAIGRVERLAQLCNVQGPLAEQLAVCLKDLRVMPSEALLERVLALTKNGSGSVVRLQFDADNVPLEIREELAADAVELDKCMSAGCFRSAIILCGRLLETALHRKYFELTGNDLLEKAPGIGLGTVIAKMAEQGESLDPGLGNQIHLINQVRVWSVHKKHEPFCPSKAQAQAIALYTMDVVQKLWK